MNTSVCGIGNVNAPVPVECQIKRFPVVIEERVWSLVSGRWRLPVATQREAMQSKHAQAVISGIANKQIASANSDAVRLAQLARSFTSTCETGNDMKGTVTRIETLELQLVTIEKIDAAIGPECDIGRSC